jgi:hypothetical protein
MPESADVLHAENASTSKYLGKVPDIEEKRRAYVKRAYSTWSTTSSQQAFGEVLHEVLGVNIDSVKKSDEIPEGINPQDFSSLNLGRASGRKLVAPAYQLPFSIDIVNMRGEVNRREKMAFVQSTNVGRGATVAAEFFVKDPQGHWGYQGGGNDLNPSEFIGNVCLPE